MMVSISARKVSFVKNIIAENEVTSYLRRLVGWSLGWSLAMICLTEMAMINKYADIEQNHSLFRAHLRRLICWRRCGFICQERGRLQMQGGEDIKCQYIDDKEKSIIRDKAMRKLTKVGDAEGSNVGSSVMNVGD